jgi:ASC-1-like (ASCH) protein
MPTTTSTHPLHIQNIWYDAIASGKKTWEGRLNDGCVSIITVGDHIDFISENREPLKAAVVGVQHFTDFEKMLDGEGLRRLLPGVGSVEEGLEIYRAFPGYREGEREFGAVVFQLELS